MTADAATGPAGLQLSERYESSTRDSVIPLDDINRLVRGRHGWFLANRFDVYLGSALIRYGEFSEIEGRFLTSLLRPGDFVVEAGSNIGAHTVPLAKAVGPEGCVVAIEPQPEIFRTLCANLALNGLSNVIPYSVGCGSRQETMVVPAFNYRAAADHNSGGVSLGTSGPGHAVPVVPLDDLVAQIPGLRLLKVDVEGMEKVTLEGASRLIATHRPLLYVENDRVEKSRELITFIQQAGYRLWWHMPALFNPANFFGVEVNAYPNIVSFNMFCQPREAAVDVDSALQEITDASAHPRGS